MNRLRWVFPLLWVFLPSAAVSNALSISEQTAVAQKPATQAEQRLHKSECAWLKSSSSQKVTPAPGVVGRLISLDDIQIVKALEVRRITRGEDGFSIRAFAPLPNGGIAGKDFCALVQYFTFQQPDRIGAVPSGSGVVLRSGVDLIRDYPNTSRAITAGDYLATSSAGAYLVFDVSNRKVEAWWAKQGATWNSRRKDALAFSVNGRLFYPVIVK